MSHLNVNSVSAPRPQPQRHIDDCHCDHSNRRNVMASIAQEITCDTASSSGHIGEYMITGNPRSCRTVKKQDGNTPEQSNCNPIIDALHRVRSPSRVLTSRAQLRKAILLTCCALAACTDATPKGQVLAQVGDEAITRLDFDAELAADPASAAGQPSPRTQLLERLIDRALMVEAARRQKLHLTPEYLAATRRSRDDALIDQLRRHASNQAHDPSPQELDHFIADHRWMFAERQQLVLDQIIPARRILITIERLTDLDAVAQTLAASGIPFQRSALMIDSGSLSDAEARLLTAVPLNVPRSLGTGTNAKIVAVASRAQVPIKGDLARKVAREVIRRDLADRALNRLLATERARTEVRYRQDLSPAAR